MTSNEFWLSVLFIAPFIAYWHAYERGRDRGEKDAAAKYEPSIESATAFTKWRLDTEWQHRIGAIAHEYVRGDEPESMLGVECALCGELNGMPPHM